MVDGEWVAEPDHIPAEWSYEAEEMEKYRKMIEEKYPDTFEMFIDRTQSMIDLFCKKQLDYGPANIGLGKEVLKADADVLKSLMGLSIRINDKVQRVLNLTLNNQEPNNESLEDTYMDIANYCIMALIVMEKKWGK